MGLGSKIGIGCGGAVAALLILGLIGYGVVKSKNNKFVRAEEEIVALDKYVANKMNTAYQDLKTSGSVRNMSMEDFTKIVQLNTDAKIPAGTVQPGAFGGMAVTRQNMGQNAQDIDKDMLKKIQPYMKEVERAQTLKIKAVRNYRAMLREIPEKWFASWLGFPTDRVDLKKADEIMRSGETAETQRTGIQDAINPVGTKNLDGKTAREAVAPKK
jgi:hypothetical protein